MAMNTPASLHKLTVLSWLLDELRAHTLAAQNKIIKAVGEEDLRYMLLNRYPIAAKCPAGHHGGAYPGAGHSSARHQENY